MVRSLCQYNYYMALLWILQYAFVLHKLLNCVSCRDGNYTWHRWSTVRTKSVLVTLIAPYSCTYILSHRAAWSKQSSPKLNKVSNTSKWGTHTYKPNRISWGRAYSREVTRQCIKNLVALAFCFILDGDAPKPAPFKIRNECRFGRWSNLHQCSGHIHLALTALLNIK